MYHRELPTLHRILDKPETKSPIMDHTCWPPGGTPIKWLYLGLMFITYKRSKEMFIVICDNSTMLYIQFVQKLLSQSMLYGLIV